MQSEAIECNLTHVHVHVHVHVYTYICGGGWREESCQGEWCADESKCPRPPRDATAEVEQAT